jgi:hypothetical protein
MPSQPYASGSSQVVHRSRARAGASSPLLALIVRALLVSAAGCSGGAAGDPPGQGSGGNGGGATGGTSGGSGGAGSGGQSGGSGGASGSGGTGSGGSGGQTEPQPDARPDAITDTPVSMDVPPLPNFSFFVTSVATMRKLSGSQNGFGGDLRFGKADGLSGADEICRQAAELGLTGAGAKPWRAFLSTATSGPGGTPVNAIDRVGDGPWYDRLGRLVAMNKADLIQTRPRGAATVIINDLPNEFGVPNHAPDPGQGQVDNHDMLTGSKADGTLYSRTGTCADWTSTAQTAGRPRCGHSWPRGTQSWISVLDEAGCGAGINLVEMGGPRLSDPTVGSGGGYGGIYCLSTVP